VPTFLHTLARRVVSIGAVTSAFVMLLAHSPLLLPLAATADAAAGRFGFPALRFYVFVLFMLAWEVFGVLAAFVLWLAHAATLGTLDPWYRYANYRLQWFWGSSLAQVSVWLFGLRLEVEGADCVTPGGAIYLFRHTSFADTILPVHFISRPHGLKLRYVLKRELLWDPCLDIVGQRLPNRFIARDSGDRTALDAVGSLAEALGPHDGVLIFPEGTRFTRAKRDRIVSAMRKHPDAWRLPFAEAWQHVLPPKLGGPLALLRHTPPADIVSCAPTGLERSVSVASILRGGLIGARIRIRFWRVPHTDIPTREEDRARWLFEHWNAVNTFAANAEETERK